MLNFSGQLIFSATAECSRMFAIGFPEGFGSEASETKEQENAQGSGRFWKVPEGSGGGSC